MSAAERLLDLLETVRSTGERRWQARCPAHDDRNPSLAVTEKDSGDVLVCCHAGCTTEAVLAAVQLDWSDLFAERRNGDREIAATYSYVDEQGRPLYEVVRFEPKDFRQRKPDGNGGFDWRLGDTSRVLYRLPQVLEAIGRGETVYVVEGEKDVHALERAGVVATCNPGGAGKWRNDYSASLKAANVVIVADRDEPGRDHARKVAQALEGVAASPQVVEPVTGKDAADHLAAGRSVDEFVSVIGARRTGEEIDGAELLEEIKSFISTYMILPSEEIADLLAVWTLHTHALEAAYATPYLRITSATRECGKTVLMEILQTVTARGWHAVNPSAAVLYRKIDRQRPTLLLDEMDNYPIDERRDALAVLNAGYKRGATVDRCKDNGDLESFSAFCAKAYAGIDERRLVDTLLSRSITIRLEKRLRSDPIEPWIGQDGEEPAEDLRRSCEAWAEQHLEHLALRPELPDAIINRAAEVWRPLVAIADRVGGDWPERIRRAARVLATGGDDADELDKLVLLLADVRDAFGDEDVISTAALLEHLNGLDESPWGARRRGEGLDGRGLAAMLRPLKIRPRTVRLADKTAKGYHLDQFEDAFARHLSEASQASQASQPAPGLERDVTDVTDVTANPGGARPGHSDSEDQTLGAAWDRLERKRGSA